MKFLNSLFVMITVSFLSIAPALAAQPENWAIGMQKPASPVAERIHAFHDDLVIWIITAICIFVLALLVYVVLRFNKRANPEPSKVTHNVLLEIVWTVIPVVILIIIAIPSFKLLYYGDRTEDPEMTIKVTGHQWYWEYQYTDEDELSFASYMIPDDKIDENKGQVRLLSTDNPVVLPVDTNIQVLVTSSPTDVIHSWTIPAFGIKVDAIPARLNEGWIRINKPGTYYGQCSELCGKDHAYMPIEIKAVSKEEYKQWLERAKEEFASFTPATIKQYAYLEAK